MVPNSKINHIKLLVRARDVFRVMVATALRSNLWLSNMPATRLSVETNMVLKEISSESTLLAVFPMPTCHSLTPQQAAKSSNQITIRSKEGR